MNQVIENKTRSNSCQLVLGPLLPRLQEPISVNVQSPDSTESEVHSRGVASLNLSEDYES